MKLIAFIEKTFSPTEIKVILNFYETPPLFEKHYINFENGKIQIIKNIKVADSKKFFDSLYFPSDQSGFLENPYLLEINRAIDPFIDDALKQMSDQERYKFYEEIVKDVNHENRHAEQDAEPSFRWPTCYVEKNSRHLIRLDQYLMHYAKPHLSIRDSIENERKEFSCASYKFVLNEERVKNFVYYINKIAELQDPDEIKVFSQVVRGYFKIIPFSSREIVADFIKLAPLPGNIIAAYNFIEIIIEGNGFNFSDSIWVDFLDYIEKYREFCISALKETERQDEYEVILKTSLNSFLWSDGVDHFKLILVERMKSGKIDYLKDQIHSFILMDVCKSFSTSSSIEIVNDLIKNFSSSPHLYKSMSVDNQLRIFNVYSAINCQKIFLNEESDEDKLAVNYATDRMMEVMRSVKFDAEKSIKKSFSILKKAEYRVAAALINKIVKDLDFYFAKPVVAEVYSALLLPNNPDRDWVAVCGILPSIQSNFAIREGLARQFLSIGDLEKAKPHIDAVVNFEPNSKTSIEIKALLAREEAIKSLVEDGVSVESIDKMTGVDFEKILIRKLQKIGFRVTETPGSGDYGADIILDDEDETRFIIQCKRFSSRVNLKAVQEVVAAMKHYSADYAIVATNNEFLKSAVELAKSNDVELWAGTKIMQVLSGDISETILATANLPK